MDILIRILEERFGNKKIAKTIYQTSKLSYCHNFPLHVGKFMTSVEQKQLNNILSEKINFATDFFYTNSGSESIDTAIRLTTTFNRKKIITYKYSYHGSTFLSAGVSGNLKLNKENVIYIDFFSPDDKRTKSEYLDYFEKILVEEDPKSIACMLIEPMIGSAAGIFMKENVLPEMLDILQKYEIISILDEVISGFWRLGKEFAFNLYNIKPNIIVLSKALTNGQWPLSVIALNSKYLRNLPNLGYTMAAHPVGCAAAIASIEQLNMVGHNVSILSNKLISYFNEMPSNIKIYNEGLFFGIHLFNSNNERFSEKINIGSMIASDLFEEGIICRGNPKSIILAPSFLINKNKNNLKIIANQVQKTIKKIVKEFE
jgi:4-aminobutyrate--pyruvate transaminase